MTTIPANSIEQIRQRIYSVDLLRGVVMMIMLLDHTRDFVHSAAQQFDPTDLSQTTVPLFYTRWITHFCAPTFVFLSGVSIYLQRLAGKTNAELSRFLFTRGLWLIFLEFTVVRLGFTFNLDYSFFGAAQVIWAIGFSMVVMAALIYLPVKWAGAFGIAMIALHNLLDVFQISPQIAFGGQTPAGSWQAIWLFLHQQGLVSLFGGPVIFVLYPLIPWIGVMATGWAFGAIYASEPTQRSKWLYAIGISTTLLFVVIRLINIYGDPSVWSSQSNPAFTFMSFLNTTKYPPSLLYLLMTLGPSIIVLAMADSIDGKVIWQRICITYGRVPMFYYILQWFVAHGAGVLLSVLSGKEYGYLVVNPGPRTQVPPDAGFSLAVVYATWIGGLILLYPLCKWWGNLKRTNKHWLLSYL
ncbi:MAG: heparan-alpha-glucosaminide N-acetyltransferase domain-containing protein [Acidobacteriota bacterium]